jgi:hypothetical protein
VNASSKEGATVKNFLDTLAENNRLNQLQGVCEKFGQLMSASRGEVELRVTSAQALDQKVLKSLENAVGKSRFVGQGKKLKVVAKVSFPGVVVEVESRSSFEVEVIGVFLRLRNSVANMHFRRFNPTSVVDSLSRSVTAPLTSVCPLSLQR